MKDKIFFCVIFTCRYAKKPGLFGHHRAIPILLSFNLKTMVTVVNNVTSSMRTMKYSEIKCSKVPGKIAMVSYKDLLNG